MAMVTPLLRRPIAGRVVASTCKRSGGSLSTASASFYGQCCTAQSQGSQRAAVSVLLRGQQSPRFSLPARGIIGQSSPFRRSVRLSSSKGEDDGPAAVENEKVEVDESTDSDKATDDQQPVFFPWRHESDLPTRLEDRDDFSGMPNNFRARFVRRLVACKELNLSALDSVPIPFFAHDWEYDLANNFQTAFELSLEELLSSIFRGVVPVETLKNDQGGISIDSTVKNEVDEDDTMMENNTYLKRMLDKDLIAKYQSINPNNLQLKLSIRPIEATIETIFAVPLLSREIVEKKPHLKGAYQRIEKVFSEKASFSDVKEMTFDLAREVGDENAFTRTVIADAAIVCSEFFQVKDTRSGLVVQGMEDGWEEEEVVHNVRFEVVTVKNDDGVGRKVGNWKIIDIDDLMDGNVFH
mmetsp:Transcript_12603/g.27340  ORF Transcript_12603/g.27340 Transcript_12603/m.27340 type:complete len:410 (+) Transcript_12603:228-1457(+)